MKPKPLTPEQIAREHIELRVAMMCQTESLCHITDALIANDVPTAVRHLGDAVNRIYRLTLRHAKAQGYKAKAKKGKRKGNDLLDSPFAGKK